MESTGIYWQPVYNLLEEDFSLLVVNAQHIKAVPGRKTDGKDAEWIADLLRQGLVRNLIRQRSQAVNRIQRVLEGANIKLSSVVSDVLGASGRAMLEAMLEGIKDPQAWEDLAKGTLRKKRASQEEALNGRVGRHQQMMLDNQLRHLDFLDGESERLNQEVASRTSSFEGAIEPGVGLRTIEDVLAEIGTDMTRFPTSNHLSSWAKICPGNNESGGKRKRGRSRRGNPWLKAAWTAGGKKGTYIRAQYYRLASRRDSKRAILAVAQSILITIYYMLRDGTRYRELRRQLL